MGKKDARVDEYISKSAEFAQPILIHLRELVHKGCPDVEETIKWGFPHFDYKGVLCSMASFKQHCAFTFWKASLMTDPKNIFVQEGETAMGQLGRISSLDDLPSDKILLSYIKEAVRLNDEGVKIEKRKPAEKKEIVVPAELQQALKKNKLAKETFENFSNSHQREYIEWITEAKTEATREKRITTTIEWLTEGKPRMWRYMKK